MENILISAMRWIVHGVLKNLYNGFKHQNVIKLAKMSFFLQGMIQTFGMLGLHNMDLICILEIGK